MGFFYTEHIVKKKTQPSLHKAVRHHTRMVVVPHKKNQYRPHLIRVPGLMAVAVVVLAMLGLSNMLSTGSVLGDTPNISVAGLLNQSNAVRQSANRAPLELNAKLTRAAELKAADMLTDHYWAHTAPDGTEPWAWFHAVDYSYLAAGENLARDFTTDQGVVAAWMNSREHRNNVLNEGYTQVGFATAEGVLAGSDTTLVVALYATPLEAKDGVVAGSFINTPVGTASIMTRAGYYLQALSPAVLASLVLLMITAAVAFFAHAYRKKLPKAWRTSWRKHHGAYTGLATSCALLLVVLLYSGGQI